MKTQGKARALVDIGFAALPIFCSLLGAVLMITLNLRQSGPQPLPREKLKQMQAQLQRLQQVTAQLVLSQPVISNRLGLAEGRLSLRILDRHLAEARQEKQQLEQRVSAVMVLQGRLKEKQEAVATLQAETEQARARVNQLLARVQAADSNAVASPFGGYLGPMVFVECKSDEVVVYPGSRKLAANAPAWDMNWLFEAIEQAGFVVLAARPDSFDECYPRLQKLIYKRIEEANEKRTQKIGRCSFPIPATALVEQYLPKEDPS